MKLTTLVLASALALSSKDPPPTIQIPSPSPMRWTYYLEIEGLKGTFEVDRAILLRYRLENGQRISRALATRPARTQPSRPRAALSE